MDTNEFLAKLNHLVNEMDEAQLMRMLSRSEKVVEVMVRTDYYHDILGELRDRTIDIRGIAKLMVGVDEPATIETSLIFWLAGLRSAHFSGNSDLMLWQATVFVAAQQEGICRIEHDRLRLVLTYVHLVYLNQLMLVEEGK